ncbi:MAG: hypothetical protein O2807_04560 [bacterium]|nr:hypothetical protein [bacterium]
MASVILLAGLVAACSQSKNFGERPPRPQPWVKLEAVPPHVLAVPRVAGVWLWDRPGGPSARAVRLVEIPSGTVGKVMSFDEGKANMWGFNSRLEWEQMGLHDPNWQPVRWAEVATRFGKGWVRIEFLNPLGTN